MRTRFPQHRQLALLDLFAECTPDQIRAIDHLSTEVAVSPGTQVWHEDRTEPQFIVVVHGEIKVRPMMYLALSYDHRIVDGREAVTFLVRVKEILEDPARQLLDL